MDTCCFVDYLNGCERDFNYTKIEQFARDNNFNIIISVYSLLEIVQSLNSEKEVEDTIQKFMRKRDFWVLNVNRVLGEDTLFEYGPDFWLLLKMGKPFTFEEFQKERQEFYAKCYKSLYPKMYLFTELMTQMYLLFKECKAKTVPGETIWTMNKVHSAIESRKPVLDSLFEMYFIHSGCARFNLLQGNLDEATTPRDVLQDRLFDLMIELIAVVKAKESLIRDDIDDDGEFNCRISAEYHKLLKKLTIADLARQAKKCKDKTQGILTVDYAFDLCANGMEPKIIKDSYKKMLKRVFTNGNFGKSFNNSFIDFTNLGLMELFEDRLKTYNAVYLTRDKEWLEFMFKHNDKIFVKNTRRFYDEFGMIG